MLPDLKNIISIKDLNPEVWNKLNLQEKMMVRQLLRIKKYDADLEKQITIIKDRNTNIENHNKASEIHTRLLAWIAQDADDYMDSFSTAQIDEAYSSLQKINIDPIQILGVSYAIGASGQEHPWIPGEGGVYGGYRRTERSHMQSGITALKNRIDNLTNEQQIDMTLLQKTSSSRGESYEMTSNFSKSVFETYHAILRG